MTDAPPETAAEPDDRGRPPQDMRLRPRRASVTRLSRRVLVGLGGGRGRRDRRRPVLRLAAPAADDGLRALQHRQPIDTRRARQPATRLRRPPARRSEARPAASRRPRQADPQRRRAGAGNADVGVQCRRTARRPGTGGGAHQPPLRDDQRPPGHRRDRTRTGRHRRWSNLILCLDRSDGSCDLRTTSLPS